MDAHPLPQEHDEPQPQDPPQPIMVAPNAEPPDPEFNPEDYLPRNLIDAGSHPIPDEAFEVMGEDWPLRQHTWEEWIYVQAIFFRLKDIQLT